MGGLPDKISQKYRDAQSSGKNVRENVEGT